MVYDPNHANYLRKVNCLRHGIKWFSVLLIALMVIMLLGCEKAPIKIGFIADLSAKTSQLGVDARNAMLLRVEQINNQGGVKGRMLEVVVKDDKGDVALAKEHFTAFKAEGVQYVVGPLTSSLAEPALNAQSEDLLIVSPSISGDVGTAQDDYFIRTCQLNIQQARQLSDFLLKKQVPEVAIIYTLTNRSYTETMMQSFKALYEENGGKVASVISYEEGASLKDLAEQAFATGAGHTVIASHSLDTAVIQQHLKQLDPTHQTYGIQWAMTHDLIENGGRAVEGMYFIGNYKAEVDSEAYVQFTKAYSDAYNYPAAFITYWTYDTIEVLVYGLNNGKSLNPVDVKAAIIEKGDFEGIDQRFSIDAFGDSNKQYSVFELKSGAFMPIKYE